MNKALAVQSARLSTALANPPPSPSPANTTRAAMAKKLHMSAEKKANVNASLGREGDQGGW